MPKLLLVSFVSSLLLTSGCAAVNFNPTSWHWPSLSGESAAPGTPEWWKKHKSDAELVPGEGFRVAGFDGYFDQEGRPIGARVAKVVNAEKSSGLLNDVKVIQKMSEVKTQVGYGPDEQRAKEAYAAGEDFFRRQEYESAAKQFKQTVARWPDSSLEQDAMFFLGESQFFSDNYPDAVDSYEELLRKYPNSPHLDKVIRRQFDIARYWEQHHQYDPNWPITPNLLDDTRPLFDTLGRSLKTYDNIRLNDPTGPLADDSLMATANSYFVRNRYNDADFNYEQIRREYPRSEHQFEAHILGLQCKIRKYQGPDYDGTPLIEAKKLVKQLKQQFAGRLSGEERDRVAIIEVTLRKQLAERDYSRAKFYDETGHFGSAKYYYAQLMSKFPNTPLAEQAQQRYADLGGKPDHPETKLEWLVDVFPENAERQAISQVPLMGRESEVQLARQPKAESQEADATIVR